MKPSDPAGIALVVAFPLGRRRALVKNLTKQMLDRSPVEAEKHLAFELSRHRRLLRRWQLSEPAINAQVEALRSAVRHALRLRMVSPPSGGRQSDGQRGDE